MEYYADYIIKSSNIIFLKKKLEGYVLIKTVFARLAMYLPFSPAMIVT